MNTFSPDFKTRSSRTYPRWYNTAKTAETFLKPQRLIIKQSQIIN